MMEKLKKIRIDTISLLLVLFCSYFLGMVGIGISIIFLIIYIKSVEKKYFLQKLLLILSFTGIIFFLGGFFLLETMENKGIDGIGEAMLYAFIVRIGRILLIVCPIILLIIDNKKFLFRKRIITISIIFTIAIFSYFPISKLITTTRISDNIPTVQDFEKELTQRFFLTDTANYRLYGINSKNKKAIALSFEKNSIDKYPLYVYSVVDFPWLIYFANGEIYAVRGKYWDYYTTYNKNSGYNEEKIIWDYPYQVISEREYITVYDIKLNRYEKGSSIYYTGFNYYSQNHNIENSIFIDIPRIEKSEYLRLKIKQINRIDINSLNY